MHPSLLFTTAGGPERSEVLPTSLLLRHSPRPPSGRRTPVLFRECVHSLGWRNRVPHTGTSRHGGPTLLSGDGGDKGSGYDRPSETGGVVGWGESFLG